MVEVLVNGQFGYYGTHNISNESIINAAKKAFNQAKSASKYSIHSFTDEVRPKSIGNYSSQYQLKDMHSGKQYILRKKDFEKYTKKKQFKQIKEEMKVNIDALLKNPKISKLLKKLSIVKIKSREDVVKVLNYFARNPHMLSAIKPLFEKSINESK